MSSTETAVWLHLCASMPITIMELCPSIVGWHGPVDRHIPMGWGDTTLLLSQIGRSLLGVGWPQNKLKPRRRRSRQSEPADTYTLTLGSRRLRAASRAAAPPAIVPG